MGGWPRCQGNLIKLTDRGTLIVVWKCNRDQYHPAAWGELDPEKPALSEGSVEVLGGRAGWPGNCANKKGTHPCG